LEVSVEFFYEDMEPGETAAGHGGFAEPPQQPFDADPLHRSETIELVDAYYTIADPAVRRRLIALARALAVGGHASGR
jgi:hypothetical protein